MDGSIFVCKIVWIVKSPALSVICFANASSPKVRAEKPVRNVYPDAQFQLVSPSGRDVAQRQKGQAPSLRELDLPQAKTEGAANYP